MSNNKGNDIVLKTYKGFDKDLKCRDFQYEIGKEYEEPDAIQCEKGFHACECPLDVLRYYPPTTSRFCEVEQSGKISRGNGDTKVASTKIKIGAEIGLKGLIKATFNYVKERCTTNQQGADNTALTGGYRSALTGGDSSALTGGDRSALTGGSWSALTGGDSSALTGGYRSALTGGSWSALTGGEYSVVYGGDDAKVRARKGSVLALQHWEGCNFKGIVFAKVDGKKIKEDTYYKLVNGKFVEIEETEGK